ncbi:MAG: hypothetical protein WDN25_03975 [Acetobacteraceae bacterium]
MLRTRGRRVTLRRPGSPPVDVTCLAMIAQLDDVVSTGGATQFRRRITIGNAEIAASGWPGPPKQGDQVLDDGRTMKVQAVLVQVVAGETVMHRIETWGA